MKGLSAPSSCVRNKIGRLKYLGRYCELDTNKMNMHLAQPADFVQLSQMQMHMVNGSPAT